MAGSAAAAAARQFARGAAAGGAAFGYNRHSGTEETPEYKPLYAGPDAGAVIDDRIHYELGPETLVVVGESDEVHTAQMVTLPEEIKKTEKKIDSLQNIKKSRETDVEYMTKQKRSLQAKVLAVGAEIKDANKEIGGYKVSDSLRFCDPCFLLFTHIARV